MDFLRSSEPPRNQVVKNGFLDERCGPEAHLYYEGATGDCGRHCGRLFG